MNPNLTQEQVEALKRELQNLGIPFEESMFQPQNIQENIQESASLILSNISIQEIEDKISRFQKIDLKNISDEDLSSAMFDVMNIDVNGKKVHFFLPLHSVLSVGTKLYRVRTVDLKDMAQFSSMDAYWNPPTEYIRTRGRLNKVHESLLYTSLHPETTFSELKIKACQAFVLIVYEAKQEIKLNIIGVNRDVSELNEIENRKYQLYNEFLLNEFTKEVQPGQEHLYRVSELIAKTYFDLPRRDIQDAWMYPSVASEGKSNVCFYPEVAKEVLDFKCAVFGSMMVPGNSPQIKFLSIRFPDSEGNISCYDVYPYLMKDLLPLFSPVV